MLFYHTGQVQGCLTFIILAKFRDISLLSYWPSSGMSHFYHTGQVQGCLTFIILAKFRDVSLLSHWPSSGMSHFYHTGQVQGCLTSIILAKFRDVSLLSIFTEILVFKENSADPDQAAHSVASDLDLHSVSSSNLYEAVARLN